MPRDFKELTIHRLIDGSVLTSSLSEADSLKLRFMVSKRS